VRTATALGCVLLAACSAPPDRAFSLTRDLDVALEPAEWDGTLMSACDEALTDLEALLECEDREPDEADRRFWIFVRDLSLDLPPDEAWRRLHPR
jgi:hypothetical protein